MFVDLGSSFVSLKNNTNYQQLANYVTKQAIKDEMVFHFNGSFTPDQLFIGENSKIVRF